MSTRTVGMKLEDRVRTFELSVESAIFNPESTRTYAFLLLGVL